MLELRHISKRYGRGAIGADDVSLVVEPGQIIALFGPSGSGKTSILHIMGLLQEPDEGEVWLDGERVDRLAERRAADVRSRQLGFVFQSFGLLPLLSGEENVAVALRLLGVGGETSRSRVRNAMAAVGISHRADHRPGEMSGGEQQRIALARALVHSPKVLLADEPTGELDTNTAGYVMDMLRRVARNGAAVVIATHDPIALDYVDTAYFVRDGTLHVPDRAELQLWITEGTGELSDVPRRPSSARGRPEGESAAVGAAAGGGEVPGGGAAPGREASPTDEGDPWKLPH
jgi:putative ABC transport system ATP-binding protein